jgi:hypothetical protein
MARSPLPLPLVALLLAPALACALACDRGAANGAEAKTEAPPKLALETEPNAEPSGATGAPGEPAPVRFETDAGDYGYRNAAGEVVIPAEYGLATEFTDEVAAVCGMDGCAFIDRTGKPLAQPFLYDNYPDEFVEGRARIIDGPIATATFGFIASSGEIVVAPTWSFVGRFSGGYAAVCAGCVRETLDELHRYVGGKWGYIDRAGEIVIAPKYDEAEPFVEGRASVVLGGQTLQIDPQGQELGG